MNFNNRHTNLDETALLKQYAKTGNKDLLGILLNNYTLMLYGVGLKYLKDEEAAKDAVQQVFIKVLTDFDKYKVTYFKSWLYTLMKNHCLMELRKKGLNTTSVDTRIHEDQSIDTEIDYFENELQFQHLQQALEQLNAPQKQCITLFFYEKKSYIEISAMSGFSVQEVKSHIQNGKRNLKIIMQRFSQHEKE